MWPPKDPELDRDLVVPAIGAIIEPGPPGWELLIGIRVTGEGYLVRDAVRVTYEVDGTEYVWEQVASVAVCTSREVENKHGCPLATNWY